MIHSFIVILSNFICSVFLVLNFEICSYDILNGLSDCLFEHGLLIEYGPICHIVKLPISMIRPFSLVNISHITLYPQLEIIWKVSKSLREYWGKYGQISFYIISCITRDCIIVKNIFLV